MLMPSSIDKGSLVRAAAIATLGLTLTVALWRGLHVAQVLLPFLFGVAAGVRVGIGVRPRAAVRPAASA